MSEYPIIIVGDSLKDVQDLCREFAKNNPVHGIERKGQAKYKIISNKTEYWVMHRSYLEDWCKGRTYYQNGKLMHSGYPIEEKGEENDR